MKLPPRQTVLLVVALLLVNGCSLRKLAVNQLGDALASGGSSYSSDDDPELIGDAVPFSLKLMETLLAESPRHQGLLLAATKGFTQYSFGWIHQKSEELEGVDSGEATRIRDRATRMYRRARNYGLRGLEIRHPGFGEAIVRDPLGTVSSIRREDVPLLYWTAASWAAAISLSKDPEAFSGLPAVEAMMDRALALDESWDGGAIHSFLIAYEMARQGVAEPRSRSKTHFERAVTLSEGKLAAPFLSYAESVSVPAQNRAEFEEMIGRALAINPDDKPDWRLHNTISQTRARWLLSRAEDLFVDESDSPGNEDSEDKVEGQQEEVNSSQETKP